MKWINRICNLLLKAVALSLFAPLVILAAIVDEDGELKRDRQEESWHRQQRQRRRKEQG